MKLVICESPSKIKSIQSYLGSSYNVMATYGHVIDLPAKKLGVDIKHSFKPTFTVCDGKEKILSAIKKEAKKSDAVYLMTDPDREGTAIATNIYNEIKNATKAKIYRATTSEITKEGVTSAIENAGGLDAKMFDSYLCRRLLDRLCGYKTSFLTQQATGGRSAGRVQSAVLRIIAEREQEIINFVPEEYWVLTAHLLSSKAQPYIGVLETKIKVKNEQQATEIYDKVIGGSPYVESVESKEVNSKALAPFTTSALIQASSSILGWTSKRTMKTAQALYEAGFITYMRTDSPFISEGALHAIRAHIKKAYGSKYLPPAPQKFAAKKGAQEGHECCRPTNVAVDSAGTSDDESKLYGMIWRRTISCQMKPGIDRQTRVITKIAGYNFVSNGKIRLFDGYRKVWNYSNSSDVLLPELTKGEKCSLVKLDKDQKFTTPPPRYSEGSITKECEKRQIGRPSTYAQCINTLLDRKYIIKNAKALQATNLGINVVEFLKTSDFCFVDIEFTAQMEQMLDEIASGKQDKLKVLSEFWARLKSDIAKGQEVKAQQQVTEHKCPKCNGNLLKKHSKFGPFYACQNYKKGDKDSCQFTAVLGEDGSPVEKVQKEKEYADFTCKSCGSKMVKRSSQYGDFFGCTKWPKCKMTANLDGEFKTPKKKKYKSHSE